MCFKCIQCKCLFIDNVGTCFGLIHCSPALRSAHIRCVPDDTKITGLRNPSLHTHARAQTHTHTYTHTHAHTHTQTFLYAMPKISRS
jgi:hypothetical protein